MELRIEVTGEIPPAKGEASSMLAVRHPQRERVRRLLLEAAEVMLGRELLVGEIGLDLTVSAPRGHRLPDATMLGGIGDVLQGRSTGADVQHLGSLARVACFEDDAQIQEIHYRRVERHDDVGYAIVLRSLRQ